MSGNGRPEIITRMATWDVLISATFGGFIFAIFIYVAFVAFLYFSIFITGTPEFLSVMIAAVASVACFFYRQIDRRPKLQWFRWVLPLSILFAGSCIIVALKISIVSTAIALLMLGVVIFAAGAWSIISLTMPGIFAGPFQRGKMVSITFLMTFLMVAGATGSSFAWPDLGFRAGLLFFGGISLILGAFSRRILKSPRFQFITAPREQTAIPMIPTSFKRDRKQYFIVLFFFKVCLGMLLRVFLNLPPEIVSMDGAWFLISLVAIGVAPVVGILADRFGRKVFFTIASGICVVMFGLFAFSGQGTSNLWSAPIVVTCLILFGIAYPTLLVSEFALFQELSVEDNRLRVIATCLLLHVTGFAAGLFLGVLFDTPNLAYFFLATNFLTIGLLIASTARETLPNKEESLWPKVLRHLYIYHSAAGTSIFDLSFEASHSPHFSLVTGGLTGISSLIREFTLRGGHLKSIQQQDATILFFSGQHVTAALIAEKELNILHSKLRELVNEFESFFQVYLRAFTGDVKMYAPTESLVKRIFGPQ